MMFVVEELRSRKPVREWWARGLALMVVPRRVCPRLTVRTRPGSRTTGRCSSSSTLRTFIDEWGPTTPSSQTFVFFLFAFVTVGVLARFGHRLTPTERVILVLTLASGLLAVRSIIWFVLAAMILVPVLVDKVLVVPPLRTARLRVPAATITLAAVAGAALVIAFAPTTWFVREWPVGRRRSHRQLCPRSRSPGAERRAVFRTGCCGSIPSWSGALPTTSGSSSWMRCRSTVCTGTRIRSERTRPSSPTTSKSSRSTTVPGRACSHRSRQPATFESSTVSERSRARTGPPGRADRGRPDVVGRRH